MRRTGLKIFAAIALLGLVLSVIVHLSTFFGIDPQEIFPPIWLLHLGIFVVFIPGIIANKRRDSSSKKSLSDQFPYAPRWMIAMTVCLFAYAIINFATFFFLMHEGQPTREEDGTFAIKNHGRFVRNISEQEYHRYRGYEVRGFSGHWMLFYSAAAMMLVSATQRRDDPTLQWMRRAHRT